MQEHSLRISFRIYFAFVQKNNLIAERKCFCCVKDLGAAIILVSPGSVLLPSAIFELWYSGGSNVLVATADGVLSVLALTIALIIAIRLLKLNPANILETESKRENPIGHRS
jgi:hypothetical protein